MEKNQKRIEAFEKFQTAFDQKNPGIFEPWENSQRILQKVYRWQSFPKTLRQQDVLQHSHSVTMLAAIVVNKIRGATNKKIDGELILTAFTFHDYPEGVLGFDKNCKKKTVEDDVNEYLAFMDGFMKIGGAAYLDLEIAYLLQFADKPENFRSFGVRAEKILKDLQEKNELEILLFHLIQNFDYILYAYEQYLRGREGGWGVLKKVFSTQSSIFLALAKKIPGATEKIWDANLDALALALIN